MPLATNPFVVLTYVSGPAILTNASALLLMSTSNRLPGWWTARGIWRVNSQEPLRGRAVSL